MTERGIVTAVKGGKAKVKVDKKDQCSKCGLCLFPKGADSIVFDADNSIGANVGDDVTLTREKEGKFLATVLVFLVPLLLIGIAVAINYLWINSEIWIPVIAVGLIVVWFSLLSLIDKKIKSLNSFVMKITEINIAKEDSENV